MLCFVDRDGILNVDTGYAHGASNFIAPKQVILGLKRIQSFGFKLCIVTNQSGIARGYYSRHELYEFMNELTNYYARNDIYFSHLSYCPHHPIVNGACDCRKPNPGMLKNILNIEKVNPKTCFMLGDNDTDISAGENAGLAFSIMIGRKKSQYFAQTIDVAVEKYHSDIMKLIHQ